MAMVCPDPRKVKQLALGQTSAEEEVELLSHLEECTKCISLMRAFLKAFATVGEGADDLSALGRSPEALRKYIEARRQAALATEGEQKSDSTPSAAGPASQTVQSSEGTQVSSLDSEVDFDPPQSPEEIGRLGSYRVLQMLGDGGMGKVYEAEDVHLHRRVALKVMKTKLAQSETARQRFLREARAAARLEHDNIVSIFQVGEHRNTPYIAMQLLRGRCLNDILTRKGTMKLPLLLRFGSQIADGLEAAHKLGIIHRDIKPSNIWIESSAGGRAKILDFGLARDTQSVDQLTVVGTVLGTPSYMPPEQARGNPVDHRADIYSLGCILYRMSTGELPIKTQTNHIAMVRAVTTQVPTAPNAIKPRVPQDLSDLIMQMLEKDPAKRPSSARAVASALRKIERSLGS